MVEKTKFHRRFVMSIVLTAVLTLEIVSVAAAQGAQSINNFSLTTGATYQMTGDRLHKYVSYTFTLLNGDSREVLVREISRNVPGLQSLVPTGSKMDQKLIPSKGPGIAQLVPPHKALRLTVWFYVSDCANIPKVSWPLTLYAAWRGGKWQRVRIQISSGSVPWPRSLTSFVCS